MGPEGHDPWVDRNRLQRLVGAVLAVACAASLGVVGLVFAAGRGPRREADCSPGARTLSRPGTVLYPEVGNGGYRSASPR